MTRPREAVNNFAGFERTMQRMGLSGNFSVPPPETRPHSCSTACTATPGWTRTPLPWWRWERSQTYSTNFSQLSRAHEIRFGFDLLHHAMTHWQPETANPRSAVNFSGNANNFISIAGAASGYERRSRFGLRLAY